MTCDALAVANYYLDLAEKKGEKLSPMKLQKLIYFAHGWHLSLTNEPLINSQIEAWEYGPVIPEVYHEFKKFGREPITSPATKFVFPNEDEGYGLLDMKLIEPKLDKNAEVLKLLDRIWEVYGKYSAFQLSNATHRTGGAWYKAYKDEKRKSSDISDALIAEEFRAIFAADAT
jgi:uncharacterized phage-associated protein